MKRSKFEKHLRKNNVFFLREGAKHSIYTNSSGKTATVPRHNEVNDFTIIGICKDLNIPKPDKF